MEYWTNDFNTWRLFGENGMHIVGIPILLLFLGACVWVIYDLFKDSVKNEGVFAAIIEFIVALSITAIFIYYRHTTGYYN